MDLGLYSAFIAIVHIQGVHVRITQFLSRVSKPTRDIDMAILSVCPSVCPSVRDVPVLDENGLT